MDDQNPVIKITNVVGSASLEFKPNLAQLENFFNKEFKEIVFASYEAIPRHCLKVYPNKYPHVKVSLFNNGGIMSYGSKTEEEAKLAIELTQELVLKKETEKIKKKLNIIIINVCGTSDVGKPVGCGIVQKAFPEAKASRFGGGSYTIYLVHEQASIRIYPSGKIVAIGFDSEQSLKKNVIEAVKKLTATLAMHDQERSEVCKIERLNPSIEALRNYGKLANLKEKTILIAENLINEYCKKVTKNPFGGQPETMAMGALYIAGILNNDKITQQKLEDVSNLSAAAIRLAYKKIVKELNIEIIL